MPQNAFLVQSVLNGKLHVAAASVSCKLTDIILLCGAIAFKEFIASKRNEQTCRAQTTVFLHPQH